MIVKNMILMVDGMHCQNCADIIKSSIGKLNGIKEVMASFQDGVVNVSYDETKIDIDILKEAIDDLGFNVIEIK
jgi:copper chaperone